MKRNAYIIRLMACSIVLLAHAHGLHARGGESPPQDPLDNINYRDAFDQSKIHVKFKRLMRTWGCERNVFSGGKHSLGATLLPSRVSKKKAAYEKACLQQIWAARRTAITASAQESLSVLVLITGATVVTTKMLKSDSFGGSFSIFSSIFNSVFLLSNIISAGFQLAFQPMHPLNSLEEQFAKS